MENDSNNTRQEARKSVFRFASQLFTALLITILVAGMVMASKDESWNILFFAFIAIASTNAWFASFLNHLSRGSTGKFAAFRASIISLFVGVLFTAILWVLTHTGGA